MNQTIPRTVSLGVALTLGLFVLPLQAQVDPSHNEPGDGADTTGISAQSAGEEGETADTERDPFGHDEFVEGELANIGGLGLVPWKNRFGFIIGLERLGEIYYIGLKPQVNWTTELWNRPFSMTFAVPFRLQLLDSRSDRRWTNAGKPRAKDWDEVSEYFQVIQNITWGGKEKHFYLDINQFRPSTIGHGAIIKRYNQNLNFNTRRVSFQFDAFSDYAGGELYLNDITGPDVMGILVFVKPLSAINLNDYMLRSFSIGVTVAGDIDAPLRNQLDLWDVDGDGRRFNEIRVNQDNFRPEYVASKILAYGVDTELKLVDTPVLDWKMYVDYSFLEAGIPTDDPLNPTWDNIPTRSIRSGGFTWGNLFRINTGRNPMHALRIRAEYRTYDSNYLPGYFDMMYEIQRTQYPSTASNTSSRLANQTKLQQVLGRDGPRVHGGYLEISWLVSHYFAMAVGLEMNSQTDDNSLFIQLEVPRYGPWEFFLTYHRRNAGSFTNLFSNWFRNDSDVFIAKSRWALGKYFHLAIEAMTPFGIGPESAFHTTVQWNLYLEIGFPFEVLKKKDVEDGGEAPEPGSMTDEVRQEGLRDGDESVERPGPETSSDRGTDGSWETGDEPEEGTGGGWEVDTTYQEGGRP